MIRVLVLGARGFLGAHVAEVARSDARVSEVLTPPRVELDLDDGVGPVRTFLHAAAPDAVVVCTGRLDGTPTELTAAHVGALAVLVEALTATGRPTRVVRLGSAGEYGVVPWGHPVREDDHTHPVTAYGASHLAATHLLRVSTRSRLLTGTTLRVFNPVGAGQRGASLAAQAAERIALACSTGEREIVTAPLTTCRDLVDAEDVARAAVAAAVVPDPAPLVLNIGSGTAVPVRRVVDLLIAIAGWDGEVREDGPAPDRSAGVGWMQADIALAQRTLGWSPKRPLIESLRHVWSAAIDRYPALIRKDAS